MKYLLIYICYMQEHKIGDLVYAKWTDCRIYPAKITAINQDGKETILYVY